MTSVKITDLTAYTDAASTDVLPIVDVGADVTKKIAIGDIVKAVPQGTAALPGLAFDGDPNTGIYSPGADQVAISTNGTGRLFIDASGNVGVGQSGGARGGSGTRFLSKLASGQSFIEVQANGTADANALIFSDGSTGNYGAYGYDHSNDSAYIQTAGLTRLTIDSSGRLGIGTTPNASSIFQAKAATNSHVAIWDYSATPMILGLTDAGASQSLRIAGFPLTFTGNGGAGSEHARIDSSGRLLVGTSTSIGSNAKVQALTGDLYCFEAYQIGANAYPAQINFTKERGSAGSFTVVQNGDQIGSLSFRGTDGSAIKIAAEINCFIDGTPGASDMPGRLVFSSTPSGSATPVERMRIHSNGDITIAKTAQDYTTAGAWIQSTGIINSAASGLDFWNAYNTAAGAYRFWVSSAGTINATSTTISAISDIRFKENITDIDRGLAEILALKPRKFDWKDGKGRDIKNDRGFIAQEFEMVFPDLIDEWKDPAPEGEEPYKSVRQDLIPILVKAIQEQQAMIIELQTKVAALEGV